MNQEKFDIVITGYGGQGVITLAELISKIAIANNYEVCQAELHGLAQRGGSVQTHIRFGKNIHSPKVKRGSADLVIALDALEAARGAYWANKEKTIVISDSELYWPYDQKIEAEEVIEMVKKIAKKIELVEATNIVKKLTGSSVATNIFMLSYAISKKYLPFNKEEAWEIIEKNLKPEYLEANKKVFESAQSQ